MPSLRLVAPAGRCSRPGCAASLRYLYTLGEKGTGARIFPNMKPFLRSALFTSETCLRIGCKRIVVPPTGLAAWFENREHQLSVSRKMNLQSSRRYVQLLRVCRGTTHRAARIAR